MENGVYLELLENNTSFIKSYNPMLVEKIKAIQEIAAPVEISAAISGDNVLVYNGLILDNPMDPLNWAYNEFHKLKDNDKDNIYIVFGLGLGYLFKRTVSICRGRVILLEPNLEILRLVLELADFSEELKKENVYVASSFEELQKLMLKGFTYGVKIFCMTSDAYKTMHPSMYATILKGLKDINPSPVPDGAIKLNIGSGNWKKEGWKTLDCYFNADIKFDLRKIKPLPFKDNQLEKVFSSHCIEHIETIHLENLIKELYRCLKPGAILRLACPDADQAFEAYKNNDIKWFNGIHTLGEIGARLVNTFVSYEAGQGGPKVSEENVREKFKTLSKDEFIEWAISLCDRTRPYIAHINGIYYEKLEKLLSDAGFVNIKRSSYNNSKDAELRKGEFDLHPTVSLFVECNKP